MPQSNYALNATTLAISTIYTHTLYCETIQLISSSDKRKNGAEEEKIETGLLKYCYRIIRMRDKLKKWIYSIVSLFVALNFFGIVRLFIPL